MECEADRDGRFAPVVVTPTYNNARTLADVLGRIDALGLPIIVVNDGSTDGTSAILEQWLARPRSAAARARVVTHSVNRGKGAALRTGFAAAAADLFTHVVTMDTDGQLDVEQIPELLAAAREAPDAMILGTRDDASPDYPAKSRVGRRVSNFLVRLESGARIGDSQCGFRVYPLGLMEIACGSANRFGFETEVLTRAAWAGAQFVEIPVTCHYPPLGQRVSHFRPWVDSWRGVPMHLRLLFRALWPWPHEQWTSASSVDSKMEMEEQVVRDGQSQELRLPWLKGLLQWLSPAEAYRQLRQDDVAGPALGVALGIGVFIANLPFYGFQTIMGLYAARRLHLNPLAVVLGTQLSTPPVGPALIVSAIELGHLVLHGTFLGARDFDIWHRAWGPLLGGTLMEWAVDWTVGGILLGAVLAVMTFFVSVGLCRWMRGAKAADYVAT
jgi:uncharacterized protein (DUF2062 family)